VQRTLYVSTFAPTLGTGRALRTFTCIKALAMLGPVELAYVPHGGERPAPEYEAIEALELHLVRSSRGWRRARFYASKRLSGVPDEAARGAHPELSDLAGRLLAERRYANVVAGDVSAAAVMLPFANEHRLIYNAHNAVGAYKRAGAPLRPWSRALERAFERRLLERAAESWMVSEFDLRSSKALAPSASLRYVPNVVDVAAIKPVAPARRGGGVLMVGDFQYPPNQTGRDFLVGEVLPRLWQAAPETRLTLVGRGLDGWHAGDRRIEVAGFVDDLRAVYERCSCVVVPIAAGGGSPLKFIEALAYGVPVVATPFAARGLEVLPDRHYREASDAASFAEAILEVLRDGAPQMVARARTLVSDRYSVEALARLLAA
jgi:glycosyltransferase involved in cell wall biosynthesis